MSYEINPLEGNPRGLDKLLEDRYVWFILYFALFADMISALCIRAPLYSVSLENLDGELTVGALIIFFVGFAFSILVARSVRFFFFAALVDIISPVVSWVKRKTGFKDYCYPNTEVFETCSLSFKVKEYAIRTNNSILYDLFQINERHSHEHNWKLVFQFLSGFLIGTNSFLDNSSINIAIKANDIFAFAGLVAGLALMFYSAFSNNTYGSYIYVGKELAKEINAK
jgi:hypothetical protein